MSFLQLIPEILPEGATGEEELDEDEAENAGDNEDPE